MRRRVLYVHAAYLVALICLLPAPLYVDFSLGYSMKSTSQEALAVEKLLFDAIVEPAHHFFRFFGISIDGHSAQLWPSGWGFWAAFALRCFLVTFPFWFGTLVLLCEATNLGARVAKRAAVWQRSRSRAHPPLNN